MTINDLNNQIELAMKNNHIKVRVLSYLQIIFIPFEY